MSKQKPTPPPVTDEQPAKADPVEEQFKILRPDRFIADSVDFKLLDLPKTPDQPADQVE
jgi:hypothetical protein